MLIRFMVIMIIFFRNVMPCSLVNICQRFERTPVMLSGIFRLYFHQKSCQRTAKIRGAIFLNKMYHFFK